MRIITHKDLIQIFFNFLLNHLIISSLMHLVLIIIIR